MCRIRRKLELACHVLVVSQELEPTSISKVAMQPMYKVSVARINYVLILWVTKSAAEVRLQLEPDTRRALETRPERNLHDSVAFLERICLLMLLNVFQLVPDRRRTCVSVIVESIS